jgi:fibronectin-binding autotransporter adhesin
MRHGECALAMPVLSEAEGVMRSRSGFGLTQSAGLSGKIRKRTLLILASAPVMFGLSARNVRAQSDVWSGSAGGGQWGTSGNWNNGIPVNGDTLFFDGTNTSSNDNISSLSLNGGINFNSTASAFSLTPSGGTGLLLSGQVDGTVASANNYGMGLAIQDNASLTESESLNLSLDWGTYTIGDSAGGTLALNGTLTANLGAVAYLNGNGGALSSTSMTLNSADLITSLGGAAMLYSNTATTNGLCFTNLATINTTSHTLAAYNYSTDSHAVILSAAAAIANNANSNIEFTNTSQTNFTLGSATTNVNTIFTNTTTAGGGTTTGLVEISIGASQTLVVGAGDNSGGFYLAAGGSNTGNKNLLTVDSGGTAADLTAGTGLTTSGTATLIFAVNGSGTGNQLAENANVTNNNTQSQNQPVAVIKTGSGGMFFNTSNTYSGGTYLEEGYIQANTITSFGTGTVFVAAGATAYTHVAGTYANAFVLSPGIGSPLFADGAVNDGAGTGYSGLITLDGSPVTATSTPATTGVGDRFGIGTTTTVVFSGQITGTGTLDLYGNTSGVTVSLANTSANNNFTGGLLIDNAGDSIDVKLGASGQIPEGAGAGNITLNADGGVARLDLNGFNTTLNALNSGPASPGSSNNQLTTTATTPVTLTLGANNTSGTFSGVIEDNFASNPAGTLSLIKTGTGTQVLSGVNSYYGATTVSAGALTIGSLSDSTSVTIATGAALNVNSGGTLNTSAVVTVNGALNLGGGGPTISALDGSSVGTVKLNGSGLTVANGGAFPGVISDGSSSGGLTLNGGTLALSGSNTFSGGMNLNAGLLDINGPAVLGSGPFDISGGSIDNTSGSAVTLSGNNQQLWTTDLNFVGSNNLNLGTGTVTFSGRSSGSIFNITVNNKTLTVGGPISDGGDDYSLNIQTAIFGVGTLVLTGSSTYSGSAIINPGMLVQVANGDSLGSGTEAGAPVIIESGSTLDLNGGEAANSLNFNGKQFYVSGAGTNNQGAIVNSGSAAQQNALQNVALTGNATFGGTGEFDLRNSSPTLALNGFTLTKIGTNLMALAAASIQSGGAIDVTQGALSLETTTVTQGAGSITYGTGVVAQFNENSGGGLTWPLTMNGSNLIGNAGPVVATVPAPIVLDGNVTLEPLSGGVASPSSNNPLTLSGNITDNNAGFGITVTGSTTVTLSGSNTYTGGTTVSSGSNLVVAAAGALPANSTLVNNGSTVIVGNSQIAQVTGSGALTVGDGTSSFTLALTGTNLLSTQTSLTINSSSMLGQGSTLDLGQNALLISDGGSPATAEAAIQQYVENGQAGPTNNGGGIIISTYAALNGLLVAYADASDPNMAGTKLATENPGDIVIESALAGDTDLNGTVNIHDLQNLLSDFNAPGYWDQGNFNGHATVDISDLQALLTNFNTSVTLSFAQLSGIENLVGEFGDTAIPNPNGAGFTLVAVPEPAGLALVALGTVGMLKRRRRYSTRP